MSWRPTALGEIIASRRFKLTVDLEKEVVLTIGKPVPCEDADDFCCPYQILGVGSEAIEYAVGIDAVQALQLAIVAIPASLDALQKECDGALRYYGGGSEDPTFPDPGNLW